MHSSVFKRVATLPECCIGVASPDGAFTAYFKSNTDPELQKHMAQIVTEPLRCAS